MKAMVAEEEQMVKELEEESKDSNLIERGEKRRQALVEKIEEALLLEENQNEDLTNLSSSLKNNIKVNYDLKTLVKSEFVYDVEPDLVDSSLTSEEYLALHRRRAESKLIKSKIIYKLYQDTPLSS
jgi:hypothetical protein